MNVGLHTANMNASAIENRWLRHVSVNRVLWYEALWRREQLGPLLE